MLIFVRFLLLYRQFFYIAKTSAKVTSPQNNSCPLKLLSTKHVYTTTKTLAKFLSQGFHAQTKLSIPAKLHLTAISFIKSYLSACPRLWN